MKPNNINCNPWLYAMHQGLKDLQERRRKATLKSLRGKLEVAFWVGGTIYFIGFTVYFVLFGIIGLFVPIN